MLKSADNSKPSRKLENEERNLDAKAPRSRVKLDPTDPPSGTRSTYFTGMSSASYQSLKARDQKQRVENYMTIRATRVSISDYVLARDEEVDFTISNFSKKIQYLNLQSPKTKHFYLTKQVLIKDYVLAPGMEVVIKLTFKAPLVGEPHVECRDFIVVDVKGGDSIVVDLEALPSIPRLEISKEVDLGKNLLDLELVRALMPLNGKISSSKDAVVKGWIKSKIKISNLGKVTTDYKFLFDEGFPIRITPMTGAVKGNSSCECVVEFLPVIVGEFNYVCKFAYGDKNLEFSVRGTVIETLVQLVTLDGKDVSQLKFLDFKNTYFGHKMKIPLLIKNGNSNDCSWMISSAGRGEVNVIQRNNVEGSQFSSSPSKGSVAPGESTFVDIEFDPKRIALKKGFTALGTQTEQVHHKVKMKFDYDDGFQKQSYTFDVVGSASPFQVKLSSSEIVFPAINTKGSISKKICLINSNPNLGARFEFDKVAHFDISPLKGVILPSQKVEIKISFVPNQYGNFSIQSTCKFYWNHSKDVLKSGPQSTVKAICHSVLSLCGSFSPKRSSVKGNLGLIKDDSEKIESEEVPASQLEWSQKLSHHEKYNKFIRGKSSDQYSEKDESVVYDNSTSLLAPEPTFAVEKEALTLKTDTFLYRKQKMIFENFKGKCEPSTEGRPWEKGWDDAALPPKELNEIYASSAVIDFGKITNHTTNRLPLNFLNASSLPIKICLDPIRGGKNCPETSFISVDVKILRLHTLDISGTEICFQANQTGEFAGSVRYIINNSYAYDIFVKAQVLPVDLVCSTDTVAIKYVAQGIQDGPKADPSPNFIIRKVIGIDYKFPTSSSQFKIANEGKFEASFEIIGSKTDGADILGLDLINGGDSDGWFTISPQNGLVTPGEFVNVTVTYIPGTKMNLKRIYNISVVDSFGVPSVVKKITITVIGSCDTSDVQLLNTNLRQGALDLGALPVITRDDCGDLYTMQTEYSKDNIGKFALTGTKSLKLKSKGENPCNFIASTPGAEKGFTVFPTFGTILPGQSVEIKVQAMAYSPAIIEDFVIVNVIGGGKGFKIPVRYEGKFPNIEIVKLESPFSENVVIGSSSSESLSVINKGQVLGRCIFDLSKFSDFSVKLVDEKSGAGNARKSAIGGDLLGLARKNKLGFLASRNIYALDIAPGDKLSLDLVFKPNVPVVYEEQIIPVYMLGARLAWTFELPIRTRATISPLKLVTSDIVFKDLILQSDATGILSAMHHKLEIENISDEPQTWAASVSCSGSYALKSFSVDAEQGLLKPGEVTSVKISFHPSKTGNYSGIIDIYLKVLGQDVSIPVSLRGNAIAPSLTFDPVELFLPVVPLHTISRAKFWIINNGCDIIPDIPADILTQNINFELSFPEGRTLRESSGRLPCVVSFVAEYPISFSIEINFHDSDGNRYQIPVSGTSDYSIITLQTQVLRGYLSNNDNISQKFRTPLGLALSSKADFTVAETFWDGVYDSVTFWFRDHLAITDKKCSPVSNSKSLETFLNLLTDFGSQNLSKIPTSDTSKGDDQSTKRTSRYFKEVIYFLANHGALVASVKARFLLSCEDFKASLSSLDKKHGTTTHSKSPYETYITHFDLISKEAWCTLFLQLIRTFAVPTGPEANAARHANVPPEKFLINWVSNIAEEMGEEAKTYTSIGEIFTDCVAIAYMLQRYVPFVKGIFKRFNYTPHNDDQLSTNMQEIQASLGHTFGAKFAEEFNISKVYRGKSLDQYLFLLFLHQSLPQFPAKDSMTFHSTLHESAFQSVEIANNSMQSVTYNASICGDSEFTTNEYVFTIPAKSRYSLTVFFKSRFVRPSSGYLIVRSKKLSLYSCSALSFCLKATVDPAIPSQVFTIEARLYSSQNNFALARISNPFSLPGNFQIKLDQKQKLKPHLTVINPPSFSILKKNILIPANSSIDLEVYFCPYDIGAQDCLIAFYDEEVGELLYKIEGKVLSPEPNESLNWLARTGLPFEKNVRIGFQNTIRSQALNAYLTLNLSSKLGSGFSAKSFRERNTILNLEKEKFELPKKSLRYKLEYSNSAFTGPKELVLKYSSESNQHTDLPLTFTPKASGKYFCRIVLSGQDCSDYRTYTVSAIAKPEETKVELEFQTMTKKALVQLLPIVNDTSAEWAIRATINAKGFSCPRSITVQPKTTSELPIEFLPTEAGQSSGSLELRNTTTKQNYSYRLVGIGS